MKTLMTLLAVLAAVTVIAQDDAKEPAVLVLAREAYQKEAAKALAPVNKDYLAKLEKLKKELGGQGDAVGAMAVQKEMERVQAAPSQTAGADEYQGPLGAWKVIYSNHLGRRYVFKANGDVEMEEMGVGGAHLEGTATKKGKDYLLDLSDNRLEVWTKSGSGWSIQHFNPKFDYENGGKPRETGKATKIR